MSGCIRRLVCLILTAAAAGCGVIPPPLPDAADLTLRNLQQIQQDPTLDTQERRDRVRELMGLDDTPESERIIDFVLSVQVPA